MQSSTVTLYIVKLVFYLINVLLSDHVAIFSLTHALLAMCTFSST